MNRNELDTEWTVILYFASGDVSRRKTVSPGQFMEDHKNNTSINRDVSIGLSDHVNPVVRITFVAPEWFPSRIYGKGGNPVPISAEERTEIARQKIEHPYEMPNRSISDDPGF